jgi:hypothetical protein
MLTCLLNVVETFLDISRDSQELVVRQLNDELNSGAILSTKGEGPNLLGASLGSSSGVAVLNASEINYSVEEVIRRVEDMSRLH